MVETKKRLRYLKEMGIEVWVLREEKKAVKQKDVYSQQLGFRQGAAKVSNRSVCGIHVDCEISGKTAENPSAKSMSRKSSMTRSERIATLSWEELRSEVGRCKACDLYKTRTNPVFGVGNPNANLLVIGEAPGANEDKQGEPFVGRGGQLLTNMLLSIGLKREDIYIANILKSRPPNNRDPAPEEVKACTPFLLRQISLIKPQLILAVGRIAAHFLLASNASMANLRGNLFHYGTDKIPLLVTYHPAYLLRSPREKRKAWQDMQCIKKQLKQAP